MTKHENMPLFIRTETTESKPVKLATSCTEILPPAVSVLWITYACRERERESKGINVLK